MRQKFFIYNIIALFTLGLSACSDDSVYGDGEGDATISITPEIRSDVAEVPVSRAADDPYI